MKSILRGKRVHIVILLVAVFSLFTIHIAQAVTAEPGTPEDPIISQSYVDSKIAAVMSEINSIKQGIESGSTAGEASKFQVIGPIASGKKIITGESTEIVLRSGAATAIASDMGGVADLVSGIDLKTGQNVTLNHLLLVPKNDGRGITITKEAWVMIRGTYTVK